MHTQTISVLVTRKWNIADEIDGFELSSADGQALPAATPGAHIDVHLPDGMIRQYSLCNGPEHRTHYRLAVKLEPSSRGGSSTMHRTVNLGDRLAISQPRNQFPLATDATFHLLLAGGIGITPLISMAHHLAANGERFALHYFARSSGAAAFDDELSQPDLAPSVTRHIGKLPDDTSAVVSRELAAARLNPHAHVYVCGPKPMIDLVKTQCATIGWSEARVHVEHFQAMDQANGVDHAFQLKLARSGLELNVPSGKSILNVLRDNGVAIDSNCEQGLCGACQTVCLEGIPDHRDTFLSVKEKQQGRYIMPCVSRCKGDFLLLSL